MRSTYRGKRMMWDNEESVCEDDVCKHDEEEDMQTDQSNGYDHEPRIWGPGMWRDIHETAMNGRPDLHKMMRKVTTNGKEEKQEQEQLSEGEEELVERVVKPKVLFYRPYFISEDRLKQDSKDITVVDDKSLYCCMVIEGETTASNNYIYPFGSTKNPDLMNIDMKGAISVFALSKVGNASTASSMMQEQEGVIRINVDPLFKNITVLPARVWMIISAPL